jgi:hypothetical protein
MPLPRMPLRMNRCYFVIRIYDRGAYTPKNEAYREPVANRVYIKDVCLIGQLVGYRQFFKLRRTMTGDANESNGTAVFRPEEISKLGEEGLQKGDRIIRINETTCDFNIIQVSPLGPYRGRHLLIQAVFEQQRKLQESI